LQVNIVNTGKVEVIFYSTIPEREMLFGRFPGFARSSFR